MTLAFITPTFASKCKPCIKYNALGMILYYCVGECTVYHSTACTVSSCSLVKINMENLTLFLGNNFCPDKENARIRVSVFYSDLSLTEIVEEEVCPLLEFVNEMAIILALYFAFSITSLKFVIETLQQKYHKIRISKLSISSINQECELSIMETIK